MNPRRISFGWYVTGAATIALIFSILYPVFVQTGGAPRDLCVLNLKMIGIGLIMYSSDYDDRFPSAGRWMDGVVPYMRSEDSFACPKVRLQYPADVTGGKGKGQYGYALSSQIVGRHEEKIEEPGKKIMLFDSSRLERNVIGGPALLPRPGRHVHDAKPGNNVGYADTHSKWRPQGQEWVTEP